MQLVNTKRIHSAGFTILEMMVAMSVLAIILLVVAAGILSISNSYFKGINSSNTQAVARSIMTDVAQNVQFSSDAIAPAYSGTDDSQKYCIGSVQYDYKIGQEVLKGSSPSGLIKDRSGICQTSNFSLPAQGSLAAGQREMLSDHMRLAQFAVSSPSSNTYTIKVTVIFGDDDLLTNADPDAPSPALPGPTEDWANVRCKAQTGSQFCAVSHLETTVQQRIGV